MIRIRKFEQNSEDYQAAVAIHNAIWLEYPNSVAEWIDNDSRRAEKIRWGRYFAEVDGEAVGLAAYSQSLITYHPQKFWVEIDVLPGYRRRGIGRQLYDHLMQELAPYEPVKLLTSTRQDFEGGTEFAQVLGFTETMREWESRLDIRKFNRAEWQKYPEQVAAAGIEIKTVAELESEQDHYARLYALDIQLARDVPEPDPFAEVTFEDWMKIWDRPNLLRDAWFVAIHNGEYVGESSLWKNETLKHVLYTGLTGVHRDYRRQGIAMALKLKGIDYAQQYGATEVRTWNEINNQGMLGINIRLGFVQQPAFIIYEKILRHEEEGEEEWSEQDSTAILK
jgi:GNAT superfamily N-acetyltransferase